MQARDPISAQTCNGCDLYKWSQWSTSNCAWSWVLQSWLSRSLHWLTPLRSTVTRGICTVMIRTHRCGLDRGSRAKHASLFIQIFTGIQTARNKRCRCSLLTSVVGLWTAKGQLRTERSHVSPLQDKNLPARYSRWWSSSTYQARNRCSSWSVFCSVQTLSLLEQSSSSTQALTSDFNAPNRVKIYLFR